MDLRRLRLFVAVAEHGRLHGRGRGRARGPARRVAGDPRAGAGARRAAVHPIAGRRHASPWPARRLLGPARQALRDVEHAAAAVAAVTGLVAGRLDLACLPTLAADPVAELVGRFRREHPGVAVRMGAPLDLEELADAVRTGAAEVGITEQGPANEGLEEIPIGEQELFAVGPARRADRPAAPRPPRRASRSCSAPPGRRCATPSTSPSPRPGSAPTSGVETAQRDALIPLVLAGAGTTFLPDTLARAAGRLGATVRPTSPRLRRTIVLVHRPGDPGPAATRFLELARPDAVDASRAETDCGSVTPLRHTGGMAVRGLRSRALWRTRPYLGPVPRPHHLHRHQLDRLERRDGGRPAHREGGHRRPGGRRRPRRRSSAGRSSSRPSRWSRCSSPSGGGSCSPSLSTGLETNLRDDLYAQLQRLDVGFHDRWQSGQLLSRAMTDLSVIRRFIGFGAIFFVLILVQVGAHLRACSSTCTCRSRCSRSRPRSRCWCCATASSSAYMVIVRRIQDQTGDLTTTIEEGAKGIRVLKAFGRGDVSFAALPGRGARRSTTPRWSGSGSTPGSSGCSASSRTSRSPPCCSPACWPSAPAA